MLKKPTYLLVILMFFFLQNNILSQCEKNVFNMGEKVIYNFYYNWGFVWFEVGEAHFQIKDITYNDEEVIHIYNLGRTYKFYDLIFKVRDSYEVYIDPISYKPIYYSRNTLEGSHAVDNKLVLYKSEWVTQ